jgi:D-alanyl-D-alanine carboxypeptidase/D-alanyl-D-alanine-endopeptidase (penicillin-binding protein 4)
VRLLTAVLALLSLTTGLLRPDASGRAHADISASAAPKATTAVLSARRAPELLRSVVADVRLTKALDAALDDPALRGSATCLAVEEGKRGVYARNPDLQLLPASTMKVLTGMAALRRLGADFHFVTEVRAVAPLAGGVIDGPLWLVGSGDPLLRTDAYAASFKNQPQTYTRLDAFADAIVASGVREIRGGIAGDESRFDSERYAPSWKPGYLLSSDVGPVSALSVNDGFTQFKPLKPLAAPNPPVHAAATLTLLLRGRGITVGDSSASAAPANAKAIAHIDSLPLTEVVGEMLRESDNMAAELLLKEMGKRFGDGGSWPAGLQVIRSTLADAGLPVEGYKSVDGSGLDLSDRVSCSLLLHALDIAGPKGALTAGFPVAGRTGTLVDRFKGNPAEGKLRAKTGTLNYVASLAGYVDNLEFALVANALPDKTASGRTLEDRIGAAMSVYPDAPTVDVLAPA